MARYWCPRTLTEEPRWVGGFLSLRQTAYVALAGAAGYLLLRYVHGKILGDLLLGLAPMAVAVFLGFRRHPKTGVYWDRSLLLWWRYRRSDRVFVGRRRGR